MKDAPEFFYREITKDLNDTFNLTDSLTILANVASALIAMQAADPDDALNKFCDSVERCLSIKQVEIAQCQKPEGSIGCQ